MCDKRVGFGRLREAYDDTTTPTLIAIYSYDAMGRRVRKDHAPVGSGSTSGANDTDYFYSGWRVLEERETPATPGGSSPLLRQFVDGLFIDEHLVMDTNLSGNDSATDFSATPTADTRHFYHTDTLYSVAALTDASGNIVEAYHYDPYGGHKRLTPTAPATTVKFDGTDTLTVAAPSLFDNPYLYTGRRFDPETGLQHSRMRYYNAQTGLWLSRDPIGFAGGINLYGYVGGLPTTFTDCYGLMLDILGGIGDTFKWTGNTLGEGIRLPGRLIGGIGDLMDQSEFPFITNVGKNINDMGDILQSPGECLTFDENTKESNCGDGLELLTNGVLGLIGLERAFNEPWVMPPTGGVRIPESFAKEIERARQEWNSLSDERKNQDVRHGMKRWHTLSNCRTAKIASITEIPWLLLGGVGHEIEPWGIQAELNGQGVISWAQDSPLDILANVFGTVGGLFLPKDYLDPYADIIGIIIPGLPDDYNIFY